MPMIEVQERPAQTFEPDPPEGWLSAALPPAEKTVGARVCEFEITFPLTLGGGEIPPSFDQGLRDFAEGKVVDMDTALSQKPPAAAR
jgi:hypothetical protein